MKTSWPVTGGSIMGSTHVRKGLPNQDAYGSKNLGGGIQVLALSDGHGGERHPHSDIGSKAAVEAAIECVTEYVAAHVEDQVDAHVVAHTDANVDDHNGDNKRMNKTLDVDKLRYDFETDVSQAIQRRWLQKIQASPVYEDAIQFGCTLLLAVKFDGAIVFLQLGDGKIAVVYTDGIVYYPIPRDRRYENNETASMAQVQAWSEMKVVSMLSDTQVHQVVLASDGVENAYPQDYYDDAFFYVGLAVHRELSEAALLEMLEKAAHYSKDDTTAILWHNPNNDMQEGEVPESLTIWMGDYPNQWLPVACYLEAALDKRIDYAISLITALQKCKGVVPEYLSLKQIYLDPDSMRLELLDGAACDVVDAQEVYTLLKQLMLLPETESFIAHDKTLENIGTGLEALPAILSQMKKHLITMKRQLRYDYASASYVCDGAPSIVHFSAANGTFALFFDSDLYLHQLLPLVGDVDHLIGRVVQHPKHKNVWGLVNHTQHTWEVATGKQKWIGPGMTMTLQEGTTVYIHGIPVKFRIINQ